MTCKHQQGKRILIADSYSVFLERAEQGPTEAEAS